MISGLRIEGGDATVLDGPIDLHVRSDHRRVVNDDLGPRDGQSTGYEAREGGIAGNGTAIDILGNHIHDIGGGTVNQGIHLDTGCVDLDIGYNHVHGCTGGNIIQTFDNLGAGNMKNVTIHHNELHDGSRYGLNLADGTDSVHVWNNLIHDVDYSVRRVNQACATADRRIEHNTVFNACRKSTSLNTTVVNSWQAKDGSIVFANNIFVKGPASNCPDACVHDGTDTALSFTNDFWFGSSKIASDAKALKGDPFFAGADDFHLKDGSPAIDASVGSTTKDDHDAKPRSLPDVGALER